jgi:hypothetical protein
VNPQSPRVAVSVTPRLYADALVRALQGTGCRIVRLDDEDAPDVDAATCEIVIVSGAEPVAVEPGRVIIRLPASGVAAEASVTTGTGERTVDVGDIQDIIELVAVHCQSSPGSTT